MLTQEGYADALREFLAASGLEPGDVPDWRAEDKFVINRVLRTSANTKIKSDGVVIPYCDLDGQPLDDRGAPYVRVRLLDPETKTDEDGKTSTKKYASASGADSRLYIPRKLKAIFDSLSAGDHGENGLPLIITEGEKKAEALVKHGLPAVGIAGISMGAVRKDPSDKNAPRDLIPDLTEIVERYREACGDKSPPHALVLFDNDGFPGSTEFPGCKTLKNGKRVGNPAVFFEALLLAKKLREAEIVATAGWCPQEFDEQGSLVKLGADDWIVKATQGSGSAQEVVDALKAMAIAGASGAPADALAESTNPRRAERLGYTALGYEGDACVIWSNATLQLVRLTPGDLGKAASIMQAVGPSYALSEWPKFSKEGDVTLHMTAAQADLIRGCHRAGAWQDSRERGGGVWLEKIDSGDVLIVNAREGFFRATDSGLVALSHSDRFSGRHVYPSANRFSIGEQPEENRAGSEIADDLLGHLRLWGWKQKSAPYLLAGWVCQQAYLGAIGARPSLTLIGESGAGKSVLAEHIGALLNGTAYRIEDGAGTTSAGMRQTIGKDAMTILLDEAEPSASQADVAQQRAATMRRTLDMLRAAYSSSDGGNVRTTIKGSASGKAVDYSIRIAAMINAINRPDLDQADRNRFLLLEVVKEGRARQEPDASGLDLLGRELRAVMWTRWNTYNAIYEFLLSQEDVGEARLRKTWGGPVAALCTLIYGEQWRQNEAAIVEMLKAVAAEQSDAAGSTAADDTDQDRAYRALMAALIECEVLEERGESVAVAVRKRTVFEVFEAARKTKANERDNLAAKSLKRVGLARLDAPDGTPRLFVWDTAQLRGALRGTPWSTGQSIVNALGRLPGSMMTRQRPVDTRPRIDGVNRSGVFVPVVDGGPLETNDSAAQTTDDDVEF